MDQREETSMKRARGVYDSYRHSPPDSPESKLARVDSGTGVQDSGRVDSMEELFNLLDYQEEASMQGLDSVMKFFKDEMLVGAPALAMEVLPEGDPSPPELEYLLEASDDDLGLPPTFSSGEVNVGAVGLGLEEEIPSYESFQLGLTSELGSEEVDEFVTLGGLFDYSDDGFGNDDVFLSAL